MKRKKKKNSIEKNPEPKVCFVLLLGLCFKNCLISDIFECISLTLLPSCNALKIGNQICESLNLRVVEVLIARRG